MNEIKECRNCISFSKEMKAGANAGFCRFNPPSVFIIPSTNSLNQMSLAIQSLFPAVNYSDWCNKFEKRFEADITNTLQ